jgi:hypothetical protein
VQSQREIFASLKSANALSAAVKEKEALIDTALRGEEASKIARNLLLRARNRDGDGLVGSTFEKVFQGYGVFKGRVTGFFIKDSDAAAGEEERGYYHVVYEDDDEEDIPEDELRQLLRDGPQGAESAGQRSSEAQVARGREAMTSHVDKWAAVREKGPAGKGVEDGDWDRQLLLLQAFVKENGHAHVPSGHGLSNWVEMMREACARNLMSADRIAAMRSFGFCFDAPLAVMLRDAHLKVRHEDDDAAWEANFEGLRAYWREHGHAHPRLLKPDAVSVCSLGAWARDQRLYFKSDKLSAQRVALLRGVDFCFDGKMAELLRSEIESKLAQSHGSSSSSDGINSTIVRDGLNSTATATITTSKPQGPSGEGTLGAASDAHGSKDPGAESEKCDSQRLACAALSVPVPQYAGEGDINAQVETGKEASASAGTLGFEEQDYFGAGDRSMHDDEQQVRHAQSAPAALASIHTMPDGAAAQVAMQEAATESEAAASAVDEAEGGDVSAAGGVASDGGRVADAEASEKVSGKQWQEQGVAVEVPIDDASRRETMAGQDGMDEDENAVEGNDDAGWQGDGMWDSSGGGEKSRWEAGDENVEQEQEKETAGYGQGWEKGETESERQHGEDAEDMRNKRRKLRHPPPPKSVQEGPAQVHVEEYAEGSAAHGQEAALQQKTQDTPLFICSMCSKSLSSVFALKRHMAKHCHHRELVGAAKDISFSRMLERLQAFQANHGHVHPRQDEQLLGPWVGKVRQQFKCASLPKGHEEKLSALGFCFDGVQSKRLRIECEGSLSNCGGGGGGESETGVASAAAAGAAAAANLAAGKCSVGGAAADGFAVVNDMAAADKACQPHSAGRLESPATPAATRGALAPETDTAGWVSTGSTAETAVHAKDSQVGFPRLSGPAYKAESRGRSAFVSRRSDASRPEIASAHAKGGAKTSDTLPALLSSVRAPLFPDARGIEVGAGAGSTTVPVTSEIASSNGTYLSSLMSMVSGATISNATEPASMNESATGNSVTKAGAEAGGAAETQLLVCTECSKSFASMQGLKVHKVRFCVARGEAVTKAGAEAGGAAETQLLVCTECSKSFASMQGLKVHKVRFCVATLAEKNASQQEREEEEAGATEEEESAAGAAYGGGKLAAKMAAEEQGQEVEKRNEEEATRHVCDGCSKLFGNIAVCCFLCV